MQREACKAKWNKVYIPHKIRRIMNKTIPKIKNFMYFESNVLLSI